MATGDGNSIGGSSHSGALAYQNPEANQAHDEGYNLAADAARPGATRTQGPSLSQRWHDFKLKVSTGIARFAQSLPDRLAVARLQVKTLFKGTLSVGVAPLPRNPKARGLDGGDPGISKPVSQPQRQPSQPLLPPVRVGEGYAAIVAPRVNAMANLLARGLGPHAERQLEQLGIELQAQMKHLDASQRLRLTFDDGRAFVADVQQQVLDLLPPDDVPQAKAWFEGEVGKTALRAMWNRAASGLLDQALPPGADGRPRLQVMGNTYVQVAPKPIGQGAFAEVHLYVNLDDADDLVIVKTPKGQDPARLLDDPIAEGHASASTMGSGGGARQVASLVGGVRTPDSLQLVYRYAEGGSLDKLLLRLDQATQDIVHPDEQAQALLRKSHAEHAARVKLGLARDMIGAVQRMNEDREVVHNDLSLRNILVSLLGVAMVGDFGQAQQPQQPGDRVRDPEGRKLPLLESPPERLAKQGTTTQGNSWMLGVALAHLFYGEHIFARGFHGGPPLGELVAQGRFDPERDLPPIPPEAMPGVDVHALRAELVRLLQVDPAKRVHPGELAASPLFTPMPDADRQRLQHWLTVAQPLAAEVLAQQPVYGKELPIYGVELPVQSDAS